MVGISIGTGMEWDARERIDAIRCPSLTMESCHGLHCTAWLTEAEATETLKISVRKLRRERQAGRLTFVMIGRSIQYKPDDLEAFVKKARQPEFQIDPLGGRDVAWCVANGDHRHHRAIGQKVDTDPGLLSHEMDAN